MRNEFQAVLSAAALFAKFDAIASAYCTDQRLRHELAQRMDLAVGDWSTGLASLSLGTAPTGQDPADDLVHALDARAAAARFLSEIATIRMGRSAQAADHYPPASCKPWPDSLRNAVRADLSTCTRTRAEADDQRVGGQSGELFRQFGARLRLAISLQSQSGAFDIGRDLADRQIL